MMNESYKWQKLLWSVVIIGIITLFLQIVYAQSYQGPGPAFVLLLLWPELLFISLIILLMRLLRFIIKRYSFIYIFTGTVNLAIGIVGFYLSLASTDYGGFWMYNKFDIWNILAACFIFLDVFIKQIGGLRKPTIKT